MDVIVNGQTRTVEAGETVIGLLRAYGLEHKMVVVEIDGAIVPKETWTAAVLAPGMKIELVHFVGGG